MSDLNPTHKENPMSTYVHAIDTDGLPSCRDGRGLVGPDHLVTCPQCLVALNPTKKENPMNDSSSSTVGAGPIKDHTEPLAVTVSEYGVPTIPNVSCPVCDGSGGAPEPCATCNGAGELAWMTTHQAEKAKKAARSYAGVAVREQIGSALAEWWRDLDGNPSKSDLVGFLEENDLPPMLGIYQVTVRLRDSGEEITVNEVEAPTAEAAEDMVNDNLFVARTVTWNGDTGDLDCTEEEEVDFEIDNVVEAE